MLGSIGAAIYRPLQATSSRSKPWQIAAAVALGIAAGVLLNQSLLGLLALGALFLLPVHYPVAVIAALVSAGCVGLIEPVYGSMGRWVLQQGWVTDPLASVQRLPLIPWFRLNNTVVMGATVFGLLQMVPVFFLSQRFFAGCKEGLEDQQYRHWQETKTREQVLQGEMLRADLVSQRNPSTIEEPDWRELKPDEVPSEDSSEPEVEPTQEEEAPLQFTTANFSASSFQTDTDTFEAQLASDVAGAANKADTDNKTDTETSSPPLEQDHTEEEVTAHPLVAEEKTNTTEELANKLASTTQEDLSNATADEVAARAAELAELVDEMLTAIQDDSVQAALTEGSESQAESADNTEIRRDYSQSPVNFNLRSDPMSDETKIEAEEEIQKVHAAHSEQDPSDHSAPSTTTTVDPVTLQEVAQHEEALRYLLHHLKEIKNKV